MRAKGNFCYGVNTYCVKSLMMHMGLTRQLKKIQITFW